MAFVPDKPVSRFKPDKAAEPAFEREAREMAGITMADAIAANPMLRMATQASKAIGVPWNMLMGSVGLESQKIPYGEVEQMQERGARGLGYGTLETVGQDIAGGIMSPVTGAALKMPAAASAVGRIAQGGGIGALAGATTSEDNALENAGAGAVIGAAIPGAIEGVKTLGRGISHMADLSLGDRGARNILDRYLQRTIGQENVPIVAAQMRAGGAQPIPGYKPTAAEAVAQLPEGSPLVAHQRITAATPGGPSAQFGHRINEQKAAIQAALKARDDAIVPQLLDELKVANAGGIKSQDIVEKIDDALQTPGWRASEVVNKTLGKVKEKISSLSQDGVVNGEDLWTIRKDIGSIIKMFSKETQTWDKRLTSHLERQIQTSIDEAIVKAGGRDWPKYMAEYAKQSQAVEAVKDTAKAAMRPTQRTDLYGGLKIAEETRAHAPQMLSRPMMMANYILRWFSSGIEPRIDRLATQRYLNPQEFAAALEKLPPKTQNQIVETMKRAGIANVVMQKDQ